jgi:hypothetical protein
MRPIFLRSVRLPSGTIEDRLSVYDCSHPRGGNLKSNGLARTSPDPLSRLFDEFSSSSGATASKTAACLPLLVCSQPKCLPQCSSPVKQPCFSGCH